MENSQCVEKREDTRVKYTLTRFMLLDRQATVNVTVRFTSL